MKIEDIVKAVQDNDYLTLDKLLKKLAAKKNDRLKTTKKQNSLPNLNVLVQPHSVAPLHIAAASGSLETCRLLLEHSAFVDVEDLRGARPLHYACANAQPALARLLLDWGATVGRPILHDGRSPLHCVVVGARRFNRVDFIHRTLSVTSELGAQARHADHARSACNAVSELINLLLEHDADLAARDAAGRTAFEYACELGNSDFLVAFLASPRARAHVESLCTLQLEQLRNAESNATHNEWPPFTASHLAAKNGHVNILRLLCNCFISLGVLQLRSVNGTPLHEAVLNGRLDTLEFLVQNGVDVAIRNSHGHTALDLTCLLEAGGADRTLVDAIRRVLTSGNSEQRECPNGSAMWRSYVTNDSLFGEPRASRSQNGCQSPHRNRQSYTDKTPFCDANFSTPSGGDSSNSSTVSTASSVSSAASASARPLAFQLPLDAASPDANKPTHGYAIYNNLSAINYANPDDAARAACLAASLGFPLQSPTKTVAGAVEPQRLCASMYLPNTGREQNAFARHAHTCSSPSHCRLPPQTALGPACHCQCQCNYQACCAHQPCACTPPKAEAACDDSHRHSSASVDSGHGSNDLKHMHSPISPCDSAVSSSRNSAHSSCSAQQQPAATCSSCHKNHALQPHTFSYHHAECGTSAAARCTPNAIALNVSMPAVTLSTPNVNNAAVSAAGSSSGSSSQGDMESGVSFSSMSSLENIDEYFLEDPLDLNALFADGLSDNDVLQHWLNALQLPEYYENFVGAGYDIATIARMTPEDLTAIGITNPKHRRRLRAELRRLNVDMPQLNSTPSSVYEWLCMLKLDCYHRLLSSQGYTTLEKIAHNLTWDDMEDIGIVLLGHQKKLTLAIGRLRKTMQCPAPHARESRPFDLATTTCMNGSSGTAMVSSEAHCPHGNCQCSRRDQSTNMNAAERVLADILNAAEQNRLGVTDCSADGLSTSPADGTEGLPATLKSLRTLDRLRETAELSRSCGNVNALGMQSHPFAQSAVPHGCATPCVTRLTKCGVQIAAPTPNSTMFAANLQAAYSALRGMQQSSTANEPPQQLAPHSANSTPVHRANLQNCNGFATLSNAQLLPHHSANQPYASPLLSRHHPSTMGNAPAVPKRQHSLPMNANGTLPASLRSGLPTTLAMDNSNDPSAHLRRVGCEPSRQNTHSSAHRSTDRSAGDMSTCTPSAPQNMHYRTLPHLRSHTQRISSVPEQDECDTLGGTLPQPSSTTGGSSAVGSAQNLRGSSASIDSVNTATLPFANDNCGTIRQRPNAGAKVIGQMQSQSQSQCRSQNDERDASRHKSCSSQSLTSSPTLKGAVRKANSSNEHSCFSPGSSLSSSSSSCSSANTVLLAPATAHDGPKAAQNLDDLNSILNDLSSAFDTVLSK